MGKRKYKIGFARRKIIFLSLIISMSLIGVGYASWNDVTTINFSMKTGFVRQLFKTENNITFEDGDIFLRVSDDEQTLNIKGDVYPDFNEDLTINIVDKGTVPSFITEICAENNNISASKGSFDTNQTTNLYNFNKKMDSFKININPDCNKNNNMELGQLNAINSNCDAIASLEYEIEFLKEKISLYDNKENFNFNYIISYELGSWKKNLYINGDIDVIPNPEVLDGMNIQIEKLQTQLGEQKEYEKQQQLLAEQQRILLEQQKLQDEQKLLELENDNLEQKSKTCSSEKTEDVMNDIKQENSQDITIENGVNNETETNSNDQDDNNAFLIEENNVENEDKIEKLINEPLKLNNETEEPGNEIEELNNEQERLDTEKEESCLEKGEPSEEPEKTETDMKEHSDEIIETPD